MLDILIIIFSIICLIVALAIWTYLGLFKGFLNKLWYLFKSPTYFK